MKQGLRYISHDQDPQPCPFCQQDTITKNIIDSIRDVFDEAYEKDMSRLESIKSQYQTLTSSLSIQDLSKISMASKEIVESWNISSEALKASIRENILLIDNKIKSPSTPIALTDTSPTIDLMNGLIKSLNELIDAHNDRISNKRRTREDIKARFWTLMRFCASSTSTARSRPPSAPSGRSTSQRAIRISPASRAFARAS